EDPIAYMEDLIRKEAAYLERFQDLIPEVITRALLTKDPDMYIKLFNDKLATARAHDPAIDTWLLQNDILRSR
ncbi:MAG: hypothetical protein AAB483_00725, partial [Patescibacteria group bacterium]